MGVLRMLLLPRNISRKKFIFCCVIGFYVFINEILLYHLQSMRWPDVPSTGEKQDELRVMLVADPQLIGHQFEGIKGYVTRWDSDRYLYKTFSPAYNHIQPDVVIFLGDLLDEGSVTTDSQFEQYTKRFYGIFHRARYSKMIFMHGDNDVGGETSDDEKTDAKVRRFEKHFGTDPGVVSEKFVDFVKVNYDFPDRFVEEKLEELKKVSNEVNHKHFKVVVNHHSILMRAPFQFRPVLDRIKPNLLFTAHEHTFQVIECINCYKDENSRGAWASAGNIVTANMNDMEKLKEIIVPTCSYRMGAKDMGYGVAVINKNGLMKYTILWLPHRYTVLVSYLFFLAAVGLFLGFFYWVKNCAPKRHRHWDHARLRSSHFYA